MNRSVSVVIPSNRRGPYLREAVASVAAQTVPVTEIVLVDDGSPAPGLAEVAGQLGISYIRQESAGISVARNRGVTAAKGDWIAFLDDDDVWDPRRIELQLNALDHNADAIASFTGGWYMDSAGARFGEGWPARPASSRDMISYAVPPPRITTLLVRRDVYEGVGGCDPQLEPAEDNDLILRLLQRGEFAAVDVPLVGYRRHSSNVTRRGLRGRIAGRSSVDRQLKAAKAAQDGDMVILLGSHLRAFRRNAAAENLGEIITALRAHDRRYAFACTWWGLSRLPINSIEAVRRRLLQRLPDRS